MFRINANTLSTQAVTVTSSSLDVVVTIDGVAYTTAYVTSPTATATAFVTAHAATISANHKLLVTSASTVITFYGLENLPTGAVIAATAQCTIAAIVASVNSTSMPFSDNTAFKVSSATILAYVPSANTASDVGTFTFASNAEATKYFKLLRGIQSNAAARATAQVQTIDWPCSLAIA